MNFERKQQYTTKIKKILLRMKNNINKKPYKSILRREFIWFFVI